MQLATWSPASSAAASQVISSITNVGVSLVGLRLLTAAEFGTLALHYALVQFSIAVTRSGIGDLRIVRSAAAVSRVEIGLSLVLSLAVAVMAFALQTSPLALLVAAPIVMGVELVRFSLLAVKPSRAFGLDLGWLVFFGSAVAVTSAIVDEMQSAHVLLCWALSGLLGALLVQPRRIVLSTADERRNEGPQRNRALIVAGLASAMFPVVVLSYLRQLSLESVAEYRAALILYLPVQALVPVLNRYVMVAAKGRRPSSRLPALAATLCVGILLVHLVFWLVIPDALGSNLIGELWANTQRLVFASFAVVLFFVIKAFALLDRLIRQDVTALLRTHGWSLGALAAILAVLRPSTVGGVVATVAVTHVLGALVSARRVRRRSPVGVPN